MLYSVYAVREVVERFPYFFRNTFSPLLFADQQSFPLLAEFYSYTL